MTGATPKRILVYAQHLSGVGHYVRTYEIARQLAVDHQVYWIEGGRPVPHRPCPALQIVELPRIRRGPDGGLVGLNADQPIASVMSRRAKRLLELVERIRPELFLIEYFPFSKWELANELMPAILQVRSGGGMVLCSLRDVVRKTRFERLEASAYGERVTGLLNHHFDALLVHADPNLTRLDDHFPAVGTIEIPIHYTGLVSEKPVQAPATEAEIERITGNSPYVIASSGGGAGGRRLIESVVRAWQDPTIATGRLLVVLTGLNEPRDPPSILRRQADRVVVLPFSAVFLNWLIRADLSISQCGYNTVANLLETHTRALVSPNPQMSDQQVRAERLAELGLVELLEMDADDATLADAVTRSLTRPPLVHKIALDGAERTRRLLASDSFSQGGDTIPRR